MKRAKNGEMGIEEKLIAKETFVSNSSDDIPLSSLKYFVRKGSDGLQLMKNPITHNLARVCQSLCLCNFTLLRVFTAPVASLFLAIRSLPSPAWPTSTDDFDEEDIRLCVTDLLPP